MFWSLTLAVMAFSLKYRSIAFSNSSGLRLPMNEVDICSLIPGCCPVWLSPAQLLLLNQMKQNAPTVLAPLQEKTG
ncbi:hypothetical protein LDR42_003277 [Salmonella enterica]|nr:hypothetical protein [Salmonella enterica]